MGVTPSTSAPLLEWALYYASLGWGVFPCHTPDPEGGKCGCGKTLGRGKDECTAKAPRTPNGFKDATTDAGQIRKWWEAMPTANIGSPTPAVLDIEAKKDEGTPDGVAEMKRLLDANGNGSLGEAPIFKTGQYNGQRGAGLCFASGAPTRGVAPGIEIRGEGSYVLLPPSLHFSGVAYEWVRTPNGALPPLPKWILDLAGTRKNTQRKRVSAGENVTAGDRHGFLISEAGRLRTLGLSETDALACLFGLDELHCEPPIQSEGRNSELEKMVADIYAKDPLPAIVRETPSVRWDGDLAAVLEDLRRYYRRYVVVPERQADTIALWCAHTFVYNAFRVTPYLHFWSPEPGSGKTLSLEILEPVARAGFSADDLTGPVLYRFVDKSKPTLFFDEVDGVFSKKNDSGAEDLRKILNSGHRRGKKVLRMGGPRNDQVHMFEPYCPKALAGLNNLPATLAHRSIPIALKPPLPGDNYEDDYDLDEVEEEAAGIRTRLQAWADSGPPLHDKARKPKRLPELDARRNEMWRSLLRIADLAGGRWPQAAREAAVALSSGEVADDEKSFGLRLLADLQKVFVSERVSIKELVADLNALEESPWGGFSKGSGLTTRELGRRLKPYGVRAKPIRIDGERKGNGYELSQFADAFSRYLPSETGTRGTTGLQSQKTADSAQVQNEPVPVAENPANPHEQSDVPVVPVKNALGGQEGWNGVCKVCEKPRHLTHDETCLDCLGEPA